jgi:hypothetical protein
MHPLRKLRESGNATPAQVSVLLAENVVFNSPILVRPIEGRETPSNLNIFFIIRYFAGCFYRF